MTDKPNQGPRLKFLLRASEIKAILHLHRLGWSDQEIADRLILSRRTINRVRSHPNPVSAYDG